MVVGALDQSFLAEVVAAIVFVLAFAAEALHLRRSSRLASLAFGETGRPSAWVHAAPFLRALAVVALASSRGRGEGKGSWAGGSTTAPSGASVDVENRPLFCP